MEAAEKAHRYEEYLVKVDMQYFVVTALTEVPLKCMGEYPFLFQKDVFQKE